MKIGKHTWNLFKRKQFLKSFIHFLIENNISSNQNRFKIGDKVRYNWKAKHYLGWTIKDDIHKTFTVDRVWNDGENVDFHDDSGASVFWLRKARKSE